jgi:hypothetical protein
MSSNYKIILEVTYITTADYLQETKKNTQILIVQQWIRVCLSERRNKQTNKHSTKTVACNWSENMPGERTFPFSANNLFSGQTQRETYKAPVVSKQVSTHKIPSPQSQLPAFKVLGNLWEMNWEFMECWTIFSALVKSKYQQPNTVVSIQFGNNICNYQSKYWEFMECWTIFLHLSNQNINNTIRSFHPIWQQHLQLSIKISTTQYVVSIQFGNNICNCQSKYQQPNSLISIPISQSAHNNIIALLPFYGRFKSFKQATDSKWENVSLSLQKMELIVHSNQLVCILWNCGNQMKNLHEFSSLARKKPPNQP